MPLLEDLRAQNPRLKSVADDQLIGALAQQPEFQGLSDSEMQALAYGEAGKPEKDEPGFSAGFSAGVDQLQAMGGGLLMAAGQKLGEEDVYEAGKGVYDRNMAEAGENALGYGFTDLFTNPETSAWQWASYTAGNLVPTMATAVAGGGAGGVAARMLAGAAAKRAATQAGQAIGAYAASAGMETGSIMGEVENADVALAHGSIAGALDALPVMRALRKFGGKEIADRAAGEIADNTLSSLKRTAGQSLKGATGKGMLTQAMAESSTEALQTLIEQNASYWVENNGQTLLSDLGEANWKQVIDAAAAGGLGGAMMGAPAGIVERGQARRAVNKLPADRQAEGSRQAEPQAEPEPDWSAYDTPPAQRAQRRKEQAIAEARQQTAAAGGDALQQAQAAQQAEQMAEGASQDEQAAEGPRQGAEVGNRIQLAMNAAEDMEALANGTEQGKTRLRNMNAVLQRAETAYADGNIELANRLAGRAEMIGRNLTQSLNRQGSRERPATGTWERAAPFGGYLGQDSAGRLNAPDPSVINMGGPSADTTQYDPQARTVRRDERMQAQQQGEARLREQMTQRRPQLADQGIVYGDGPVARRGNANTGLDQPFERAQFSDTQGGRNPETERAQQQDSNQRVAELARTRGPTETTYLPDNTPIKTRYRVMDLAELTPSNTDDGRVNQAFPAELQPRDRTNANSQVQVRNIAANLNPERLGPSADAATGAPIIGPDGVVESGNGRIMAISQAYRQGLGSAYRQYVGQQAEAMGMDPAAIGEMQQPVLVRERVTSMDRADFARRANESTVAGMTSYEQARADADALTAGDIQQWNPDQSGDPLAASNRAFQRRFVQHLGNNEASRYTTRDGQASPELGQRMQRAVFAKAYNDSDMVEMATEQGDAMRNLTAALQGAAADLAVARETGSEDALTAIGTINDAVRLVRRSRQDGTPIRELVSQQDVFSEPVPALTADLAVTLNNNMRSRLALGEAMRYIGQAIRQRAESERNGSLFEDTTTNQDVINEGFRQSDTQQRTAARDVSGRTRSGEPRPTEGRQADAARDNAPDDTVAEPLLSTYTEQDIAEREQAARQEQQAELTESQGEATLQQSAPEGFEPYRTHVRAMGEMWAVPERAGQQQSGDSLFETREEALEEAGRNARRADQRSQIQEEAAINQQREEQQQAREKADLDELAAILGVTRPGAGKARDALNRRMRFDGRVMTRKERIERAVEDGAIMQGEGSNRRLVDEDGAFYQQSTLTKTGMDYAEALIRRREDGKQAAAQAARDPVAPEHLQATDSPADRDTSETSPDGSDRAAETATARGQNGPLDEQPSDQLYRLDDSPADQPPTAEAVRNALAGMIEQLGDFTILDSPRDLPEASLIGMALNGINPRDVRGFYEGDKLYIIANNNESVERAVRTAVHEAVGHKGIRGMLGEELAPVMRQLYKTLPLSKQGRAALDEVLETYDFLDRNNPDDQVTIAEEMIAHLLEKGYRPKAWQRAVAKIRELLRTMFPGIGWSYTDVLLLGEKSRDYLRRKQAEASGEIVQRYSLRAQPRTTSEAFDDLTDAQTSALNKIAPRTPRESALAWFKEHTDRLGTKIRQGLVDRYAALKEMDEKLLGKDSVDGSTASSSWVLARMSSAASGALTAMLNYGRIYLDPDQKVIDVRDDDSLGLGSVLGRLGDAAEIERFMGWIAGNRSARLAAEGRENLFEAGEIEGLRTLNQGTTKDGRDRGALYDEVFAEFQQYRDDVLAIAEQSGIISAENRAMWRDEFYVPFYRISEEAKGPDAPRATSGLTRAEAYKKLRGGSGNLNDLLSNTMMNFHHLLQTSLNNQAAVQAMDNAEAVGIASQAPEAQVRGNPDATYVLRDGQKVWYEVSDPLVYKAISSLADPGMNNTAMKLMRGFKRVFTNMTTTTPQFVVANMLRDSMQAAATSPLSKNIPANLFRGARTYANKRTRARMMASGGSFSFGYLYGENADELKVQLTSQMRKAHLVRDPSQVPAAAKLLWSKWNDATDFTENMSRAEIYRQNEARGKLFAAFQARDLMDFSSRGAWPAVRFLIDVVPFMNARLQGLDKIGRSGVAPTLRVAMGRGSASDKEAAARFWTVTGSIAMASIALYLNNYDDEEYRKLEDWQKDTYWFFRIGDQGIFIPKPFEVGAIATLAERMTEQMVDDKATGELFRERLGRMLTGTFSFSPVPQIAQPMLDVYSNYDAFTGRPIESMGMDRLSPSLRSRSSTTAPAQWISDASEALFGPEGKLTVSPVQVDHLIQGYLGQVGAWGAGITDTIARTMQGETKPASYWYEYQPIRRFYQNLGDEDRYNRYGTLFYEGLNEVGRVYADIKEYRELGDQQQAMQLLNDNREMLRMRKWLNRTQSKLSAVNKRMQMVQRSDNSAEFKRREMDRLRAMKNRLTEMAGRRLESAKTGE
ncbi:LPD38 domain-containing protein [Halomonas sp. IOP_31]|uniref:LPD38 domain-containing protein n=1 Tax=Halomonas sp. IOP_31 TaxID=2876584 RepID=UPI001E56B909|nr:LPD38 domain-containing protein [Halomonas sp. IOP_31]MCD6006919.1 hypothetical protein [Halomonas sp. IOP_31]